MKKMFLTLCISLVSGIVFSQNYPFSVTKSGTGEQTIIFVPGFACSGDVWKETIIELQNHYTCHVLTMAGFSGVEPEENPSFENWKKQIATYIRKENIKYPVLVGHSMGGGLVLALASDFPELVKKTVIVDALPCLPALTNPGFESDRDNDCSDMVNRMNAMNEEQFIQMQRMSVASLTTNTSKFDEIVGWGVSSDRKTYAKMYCDFYNTDLRERIRTITAPSLVLLEPHFKNIGASIEEQYKDLSGVQLKYATKGLHFIMFDDREWFMEQLSNFIKED